MDPQSDYPESWRPVKEVSGKYEVSTLGRVRNASTLRCLSPFKWFNANGGTEYQMVTLQTGKPGRSKISRLVHRLVRDAFLGLRSKGDRQRCCRHLDGDGTHNVLSNLKLGTSSENLEDQRTHGTMLFGEDHPRSRFTVGEVWDILASPLSQRSLAKEIDVSRNTIKEIRRGATWRKVFASFQRERKGYLFDCPRCDGDDDCTACEGEGGFSVKRARDIWVAEAA